LERYAQQVDGKSSLILGDGINLRTMRRVRGNRREKWGHVGVVGADQQMMNK